MNDGYRAPSFLPPPTPPPKRNPVEYYKKNGFIVKLLMLMHYKCIVTAVKCHDNYMFVLCATPPLCKYYFFN